MKRLLCAVALSAAVLTGACQFGTVPTPSSVAQSTVLDEQVAITAELAYKAARTAVEVAVDAGLLKGRRAAAVAAADNRAYAAVQAVRAAYRTGNAASYATAATEAQNAVTAMLSAIKGE